MDKSLESIHKFIIAHQKSKLFKIIFLSMRSFTFSFKGVLKGRDGGKGEGKTGLIFWIATICSRHNL